MTQIFSKFRKHKNTETKKEEKLLTKLPYDLADLVPSNNLDFVFSKALRKTADAALPFVYKNTNLHNQVTMCQIFFNQLYWEYIEHLTTKIKDERLPTSGCNPYTENEARITIGSDEYEEMPKRYRGAYSKYRYEYSNYFLNEHVAPYKICIVKPSDKQKMESLLLQASDLMDKIQKIAPNTLFLRYWFVEDDSPQANVVTKEQVETIQKVYNIFSELANITKPGFKHTYAHAGETNRPRHGARDIYNEYQNELTQKNRFWRTQQEILNAKMKREMELDNAQKIAKNAESKYKEVYQSIIDNAKKQISR